MITQDTLFKSEKDCCGCGSCVDICPKKVLSMKQDKSGFFYPVIEQHDACIDCKLCIKVCPVKNINKINSKFEGFYAGYLVDDKELISCASGGLATAISRKFVNAGGVVYGCSYVNKWRSIGYLRITEKAGLDALKTSKYAQAIKGNVYHSVIKDLNAGLKVLFIGLPCDILAVKLRVSEINSINLYLIELVCHGPTSISAHQQYINNITHSGKEILSFTTRAKKDGMWKPFYIKAKFSDGSVFFEKFHKSSYGAAFRYLKRPSCYFCEIKGCHLAGDLMIGDYHYVEEGMKGYNKHGVSSALVHTLKGSWLLADLETVGFQLVEINKRFALGNGAITKAIAPPAKQDTFRKIFEVHGLQYAARQGFVKRSNFKRSIKEVIMKNGVKIKRLLFPSSKPHD